jgi:hypothetical protein
MEGMWKGIREEVNRGKRERESKKGDKKWSA